MVRSAVRMLQGWFQPPDDYGDKLDPFCSGPHSMPNPPRSTLTISGGQCFSNGRYGATEGLTQVSRMPKRGTVALLCALPSLLPSVAARAVSATFPGSTTGTDCLSA